MNKVYDKVNIEHIEFLHLILILLDKNENLNLPSIKQIGPGILLAGAAIGVSHLVQSTRAGAEYGYILLPALLLACLSKFPFMLFAAKYTSIEQKDLLEGYAQLGKWPLRLFYLIHFGSMWIITAAVSLVTAGIVAFLTGFSVDMSAILLLSLILLLLFIGDYSGLDAFMKIIISILTIMTVIAVLMAIGSDSDGTINSMDHQKLFSASGLAFLIAFMGWMPIPIDASVWHSVWSTKKISSSREKSHAIVLDFKIGYIAASLIAVFFFLLGTLVLYGTPEELSDSSVVFVQQFVQLYASVFGDWSQYVVSIAALFTMISTTLAVADAYPRVSTKIFFQEFRPKELNERSVYLIALFVVLLGSMILLYLLPDSLGRLVDLAAGLSFTTSPVLAYFNYRLVKNLQKKGKYHLSCSLEILSFMSLGVLIILTSVYLFLLFN